MTALFHSLGCGGNTSNQDRWQSILQDSSRTNDDKLVAIAEAMFDCESAECSQVDGRFQVSIVAKGLEPTVIAKTTATKNAEIQKSAHKSFQLRSLISQLGNYVHYMRSHHLGMVRVQLMVNDVTGENVSETRSRAYELELEPEQFDAFIEASKKKSAEAIPSAESLWRVTFDRWK